MRSAILANFFVAKSAEVGADLSALQLHKLVYFAHAWHLGYLSKPLIDEVVQAWQYGPAIPAPHRDLEQNGRASYASMPA